MDDVLNLAQVKAELSYLNRLDERRETNVASLKRLKEARDALLGKGSEVAGVSTSRRFSGRLKPRLRTTAGGGDAFPVIASAAKQSTSPLAAPWIASLRSQ